MFQGQNDSLEYAKNIQSFQCLLGLQGLQGVFIKQQWSPLESYTGCQTPNHYFIYPADHEGKYEGEKTKRHALYIAKEKSECLERICLPVDCRGFEMTLKTVINGDMKEIVMKYDKDCRCTFMCLNRPHMDVELVSGDHKEIIGRIFSPFFCCDRGIHIFGKQDELRYKMIADCCQLGFYCACPCESCQRINFTLTDASNEKVGEISKVSAGFLKALCCPNDTDCFRVPFPKTATTEDKVLLMAATILTDFMFFEKNVLEDKNQQKI